MNVSPVLADTGRPATPGTVNLLNAGWTATTAAPVPDGGYTLPGQALAVFLKADWNELNRPYRMVIELVDDEGQPGHVIAPAGLQPVRIEQEIILPSVFGAPNGTPSALCFLLDLPTGTLRITAPRRRYTWRVTVGDDIGEVGFWVNPPPTTASFGPPR